MERTHLYFQQAARWEHFAPWDLDSPRCYEVFLHWALQQRLGQACGQGRGTLTLPQRQETKAGGRKGTSSLYCILLKAFSKSPTPQFKNLPWCPGVQEQDIQTKIWPQPNHPGVSPTAPPRSTPSKGCLARGHPSTVRLLQPSLTTTAFGGISLGLLPCPTAAFIFSTTQTTTFLSSIPSSTEGETKALTGLSDLPES